MPRFGNRLTSHRFERSATSQSDVDGSYGNRLSVACHSYRNLFCCTAQPSAYGCGLVLAAPALFHRKPRTVWISKLVRRHARGVVSQRTLGGAFDCCRGSEPHFSGSGSAVASPRHWRVLDVSALAATNCRSQMLLLRADLRNLGGTSAFNRDRQSGHFTFHVSAAALLFATRLGHGWTRYSQTNLPAPPALADRLCRNRRSAVCRALAAENVERAFSSCNPPWRSKHSCARYCY